MASEARPGTPGRGEHARRAILDADIARDALVGGTVAYTYFPSKEALFIAAVDEDAAAVMSAGLSNLDDESGTGDWRLQLILDLFGAVEHHPLARRLLAGLEPGVTSRVLDISAVAKLRKACIERVRSGIAPRMPPAKRNEKARARLWIGEVVRRQRKAGGSVAPFAIPPMARAPSSWGTLCDTPAHSTENAPKTLPARTSHTRSTRSAR